MHYIMVVKDQLAIILRFKNLPSAPRANSHFNIADKPLMSCGHFATVGVPKEIQSSTPILFTLKSLRAPSESDKVFPNDRAILLERYICTAQLTPVLAQNIGIDGVREMPMYAVRITPAIAEASAE